MDQGHRILLWAQENEYSLAAMAATIGYNEQTLADALHHNRINPELAEALWLHFRLRVIITGDGPDSDDNWDEPEPPEFTNGTCG